ncbi:hypothetical protein ACFLQ7_04270 [Actinomycetota bacterium]
MPTILAVLLFPVISAVVPDTPCSGFHSNDRQRLESAEIEQSLGINEAREYLEQQSELEALGCTVEGAESDDRRNGWYLALWFVAAVLVWLVYNVTGRVIGVVRQVPDPAD